MSEKNFSSVAIAIITYKRPESLCKTLEAIAKLSLPSDIKIVCQIIDNDLSESARKIFSEAESNYPIPLHYTSEPEKGIPAARNAALKTLSSYDYIAFIDDDDEPNSDWLTELWACLIKNQADVARGIIQYHFPKGKEHIAELGIFGNPPNATNEVLDSAWTNNVIFGTRLINEWQLSFDQAFRNTGGSDNHFFREAALKGAKIVMCREAIVHTQVPEHRTSYYWLARRHLRVGSTISISDIKHFGYLKAFGLFKRSFARDAKHGFMLQKAAIKKNIPHILAQMHGWFLIGRLLGMLFISPKEYKR